MVDPIGGRSCPTQLTDIDEQGACSPPPGSADDTSLLGSAEQLACTLGGDPKAFLAALLLRSATDRRADTAHQRDLAEQTIEEQEQRVVELMHEKADEIREAAWQGLACGLAASGSQIAGVATKEQGYGTANAGIYGAVGGLVKELSKARETELDRAIREANAQTEALKRSLADLNSERDEAKQLRDTVFGFLRETEATAAETERSLYLRG